MNRTYYTWLSSPVGLLVIAGTDNHIFKIGFYDIQHVGESDWLPDVMLLARHEMQLYFRGKLKHFSFPVWQQGTGFQQQVWQTLRHIPFGKTVSYLEVAKRIGDPKTIRAAAMANGQNNIAIVVPCHRVIGSNGKLVGYAAGLWRKQWLLDHEQRVDGTYRKLF